MQRNIAASTVRQGFTLVEILAVMIIIVILMTFVIGAFSWVETSRREKAASLFVERISTGLQSYKADNGEFPDGDGGFDSSNAVYQVLFGDFNDDGIVDKDKKGTRNTIYVEELNPEQQKGSEALVSKVKGKFCLLDPWGEPYRYRIGFEQINTDGKLGKGQNPDFDFWSLGKDSKGNLTNSKEKENSDNIGNF
ncbi:MAG: prepilin-type N-terminal cleavage/methylation domain-containing protein [Akkermansia sp.]